MNAPKSHQPQTKSDVYERLKTWDRKRAQTLKYHKKAIQQIFQSIDKKLQQSKDFLLSIKTMLQQRVNQLKQYCSNSILDSDIVLEKNRNEAYTAHHQLLKQFYNIQADFTAQQSSKHVKLSELLQNFKALTDHDDSPDTNTISQQSSAIISIRSNIKYMIQFQLLQINQKTAILCQTVSKIYNDNLDKDLYFSINQFTKIAQLQANKHRDIGKQLISLIASCIKRQIIVQKQLINSLQAWATIDGPIDAVFEEQAQNKNVQTTVLDFYKISDMTNVNFQDSSIQDFLTKQIANNTVFKHSNSQTTKNQNYVKQKPYTTTKQQQEQSQPQTIIFTQFVQNKPNLIFLYQYLMIFQQKKQNNVLSNLSNIKKNSISKNKNNSNFYQNSIMKKIYFISKEYQKNIVTPKFIEISFIYLSLFLSLMCFIQCYYLSIFFIEFEIINQFNYQILIIIDYI